MKKESWGIGCLEPGWPEVIFPKTFIQEMENICERSRHQSKWHMSKKDLSLSEARVFAAVFMAVADHG